MALRMLVVDDSRVARSVVARVFQQYRCETVGFAENGIEALTMYKKLKPDFVTLDMIMPKMGGFETLKAIKEYDPAAKVIIITSLNKRSTVISCLKAGADNFLLKPFDSDKVKDVLENCFPDHFSPSDEGPVVR